MSETANPVGRPNLYDPSFCEKAIELGNKGKSLEQISGALGITYRTLCRWRDEYKNFVMPWRKLRSER